VDLIQILAGRCSPYCMDWLTDHLRRKSEIADIGTIGTSPTLCLQRRDACLVSAEDLMVDDVEGRAEVQKDDSADITRVYCLDDLVVHGDDGGLGRMMRSR